MAVSTCDKTSKSPLAQFPGELPDPIQLLSPGLSHGSVLTDSTAVKRRQSYWPTDTGISSLAASSTPVWAASPPPLRVRKLPGLVLSHFRKAQAPGLVSMWRGKWLLLLMLPLIYILGHINCRHTSTICDFGHVPIRSTCFWTHNSRSWNLMYPRLEWLLPETKCWLCSILMSVLRLNPHPLSTQVALSFIQPLPF